jgi:hypothetical protein
MVIFLKTLPRTFRAIIVRFGTTHVRGKSISVTAYGVSWGCEVMDISHFLHDWFTEGDDVVSLRRRPPFTARKIPVTHFC